MIYGRGGLVLAVLLANVGKIKNYHGRLSRVK